MNEGTHLYGPNVIGQAASAQGALEAAVTGGSVFGGAVMGDLDTKGREVSSILSLSLEDLFETLSKSPSAWNSLMSAELDRPGGARLDALKVFFDFADEPGTSASSEAVLQLKRLIENHPDAPLVATAKDDKDDNAVADTASEDEE